MNLPAPKTIEDRIEKIQIELRRLRLLLKMAQIGEPKKNPKPSKKAGLRGSEDREK
jgi:hypothetical protein